jgi:flavin-dependent dehydrogenase
MQYNVDVLVIGAGQAGLAMGYYLKQNNIIVCDCWQGRSNRRCLEKSL